MVSEICAKLQQDRLIQEYQRFPELQNLNDSINAIQMANQQNTENLLDAQEEIDALRRGSSSRVSAASAMPLLHSSTCVRQGKDVAGRHFLAPGPGTKHFT